MPPSSNNQNTHVLNNSFDGVDNTDNYNDSEKRLKESFFG